MGPVATRAVMEQRHGHGGRGSVVLALTAVQVFFGLHYLAAKFVILEIPPRGWAALRVALAAAIIWLA